MIRKLTSYLKTKSIFCVANMTHTKPVIAVDIDETLSPLVPVFADYYNDLNGTSFVTQSFHSVFYHETFGITIEECNQLVSRFLTSHYTSRILPFQGAYESLAKLKIDFDLHIVTARNTSYEAETIKWVNTYFPNIFTSIHFGSHFGVGGSYKTKSEMCRSIGAIILLDDNKDYLKDCQKIGILPILFGNYSWNQDGNNVEDHSNSISDDKIPRVLDWSEVNSAIYKHCDTLNLMSTLRSHKPIIAAVQMCSGNNKETNFKKTQHLVHVAASQGALLVCLPECSSFMGATSDELLTASEPLHGPYIASVRNLALQHSVWLAVGGFPETVYNCSGLYTTQANHQHIYSSVGQTSNGHKFSNESSSPPRKVYNTHVLIDPAGNIASPIYRKMHLFDCPLVNLQESRTTEPGDSVCVLDIGFTRVGLSVCYDLRFPELYAALTRADPERGALIQSQWQSAATGTTVPVTVEAETSATFSSHHHTLDTSSDNHNSTGSRTSSILVLQSRACCSVSVNRESGKKYELVPVSFSTVRPAEVLLVPAAFTMPTGAAHWMLLLRARAVETQSYIVAAAQSGRHNDRRESYGHTAIIDPWGDIVAECSINGKVINDDQQISNTDNVVAAGNGEVCVAAFNQNKLLQIREKMPIQAHKRFTVELITRR